MALDDHTVCKRFNGTLGGGAFGGSAFVDSRRLDALLQQHQLEDQAELPGWYLHQRKKSDI